MSALVSPTLNMGSSSCKKCKDKCNIQYRKKDRKYGKMLTSLIAGASGAPTALANMLIHLNTAVSVRGLPLVRLVVGLGLCILVHCVSLLYGCIFFSFRGGFFLV